MPGEAVQLGPRFAPGPAWIAGYPRSGTSLVRLLLAQVFGERTGSVYSERQVGAAYCRLVGAAHGENAAGVRFVKTHRYPDPFDGSPAIVVIRDGRRVLGSLRDWYRAMNGPAYSMTDLILGRHGWGSWSDWVHAWCMPRLADVLWLRYEAIVEDLAGAAGTLAARFGLEATGGEVPPFEELTAADPRYWRAADREGNGGMTTSEEALFWRHHGATMEALGYGRGSR